jgi:hypothetical protein
MVEKLPLFERFKEKIASIGWKLFLWGNDLTAEDYWQQIYEQEKAHTEHPELFP